MSVLALILVEVGDCLHVEEFVKETASPPPRASIPNGSSAPGVDTHA